MAGKSLEFFVCLFVRSCDFSISAELCLFEELYCRHVSVDFDAVFSVFRGWNGLSNTMQNGIILTGGVTNVAKVGQNFQIFVKFGGRSGAHDRPTI